ncbi:MAG TPA: hypothetical protein DCS28_00565 [Candidatus Moranbacteria bacterium]|nr:hypothetical protein [Candidatus Moranbacteria bacterium]HAT74523.1 hypothetical protein [Candidatus Moranbacteria bacterium]
MQKLKNYIKKFFLIDDTPHKIAAGFALGIFWGIMPGEGVATTLITAALLRFNRLSATAGVLASNMWATFIVLPLAATVGGFFFNVSPKLLIQDFNETYRLGLKYFFAETIIIEILTPFFIGFLTVSVSISLFFYFALYFLLKYGKLRFK